MDQLNIIAMLLKPYGKLVPKATRHFLTTLKHLLHPVESPPKVLQPNGWAFFHRCDCKCQPHSNRWRLHLLWQTILPKIILPPSPPPGRLPSPPAPVAVEPGQANDPAVAMTRIKEALEVQLNGHIGAAVRIAIAGDDVQEGGIRIEASHRPKAGNRLPANNSYRQREVLGTCQRGDRARQRGELPAGGRCAGTWRRRNSLKRRRSCFSSICSHFTSNMTVRGGFRYVWLELTKWEVLVKKSRKFNCSNALILGKCCWKSAVWALGVALDWRTRSSRLG